MGIGFKELLIILAIALLIFGAKRLAHDRIGSRRRSKGLQESHGRGRGRRRRNSSDRRNRRMQTSIRRRPPARRATSRTSDRAHCQTPAAMRQSLNSQSHPMFEVGFTEIILILGLALLVLGPEKLPSLAQKVGRWTGRARAMARQLRTQLEHEVTTGGTREVTADAGAAGTGGIRRRRRQRRCPLRGAPFRRMRARSSILTRWIRASSRRTGAPGQDAAEGVAAEARNERR